MPTTLSLYIYIYNIVIVLTNLLRFALDLPSPFFLTKLTVRPFFPEHFETLNFLKPVDTC